MPKRNHTPLHVMPGNWLRQRTSPTVALMMFARSPESEPSKGDDTY